MKRENYQNLDYGFKIIAKIKDDISESDKIKVREKIDYLKNLLDIMQIDEQTYIRVMTNNRDFSSACGFYVQLGKIKTHFSQLEYYDYIDEEMEIAV